MRIHPDAAQGMVFRSAPTNALHGTTADVACATATGNLDLNFHLEGILAAGT